MEIFQHQGVVVLDGGLATQLEDHGHKMDSQLWSAKMLIDSPKEIQLAHRTFLEAGADCITTATYQASYEGFARLGLGQSDIDDLLILSVRLAQNAVDEFLATDTKCSSSRVRPVVGASIGPYGAFLADGSEYDGQYDINLEELKDFHARRFMCLATSGADLLAFETIPSLDETKVLLELLERVPEITGWMSFSCRDSGHLCDGTPIETAVELCKNHERLIGIGINCTAPEFIVDLIARIRSKTDKLILVYPNSGESWDAQKKIWKGSELQGDWVNMAERWHDAGAEIIGGCCRIGPDMIRLTRERLITKK